MRAMSIPGRSPGSAFKSVAHLKDQITRVVLIGPSHRMHFQGMAVPSATGLATPLGTVAIDQAALARVRRAAGGRASSTRHSTTNMRSRWSFRSSRCCFRARASCRILVGEASAAGGRTVLAELWGGPETLIVISSDLSHFHGYDAPRKRSISAPRRRSRWSAPAKDRRQLAPAASARSPACCCAPPSVDLRATTRDLRNSGDTEGGRDRVVGYGAYTFEYAHAGGADAVPSPAALEAAYTTLRYLAETGRRPTSTSAAFALPLRALRERSSRIEIDGQLRGCVGSLAPTRAADQRCRRQHLQVRHAGSALQRDDAGGDGQGAVTISILSHLRPMTFGCDGELARQAAARRSTDSRSATATARAVSSQGLG